MTDPETVAALLMQAYADGHMRGHESTVEGWFSSDAEDYAREWMEENADRIERAMAASAVPVAWRWKMQNGGWAYIDGPSDPRAIHDNGKIHEPVYAHAPPAVPVESLDASIIKEAGDVLKAVGVSGVALPDNWRWPLADELHGIAAIMTHKSPASVPDVIESIAAGWDDCYYDDDMRRWSIGDRIRADAKRLLATTPEESP